MKRLMTQRFSLTPLDNTPDIRYNRHMIIRNAAQCAKCGDTIESTYQHDFVSCSCGAIFVDGGHDYLRAGGSPENFISLVEMT